MKFNRDQITGAVSVALGIFVFASIAGYKVKFSAQYPGPQMLPGIAAFGFVVCGLGIFVEGCRKSDMKQFLSKEGWCRAAISFALLILYILGMKYIGYWISTLVFLFACSHLYAKGYKASLLAKIIFSVAVTIVIFVCYQLIFGYILPQGLLWEMIF